MDTLLPHFAKERTANWMMKALNATPSLGEHAHLHAPLPSANGLPTDPPQYRACAEQTQI